MKDEKSIRKRRRYAIYAFLLIGIVIYLPSQIVMNQLQGTNYNPNSLKWSPNNTMLATIIINNDRIYVKLWNLNSGQLIHTLSLPDPCSEFNQSGCLDYAPTANYLYWSPTNDRLAILIPEQQNSQINNSLAIWNVNSFQLITSFSWRGIGSADIFWTLSSAKLATIQANTLEVWNLTSQTLINKIIPTNYTHLNGLLWSPDGQSIITGNATAKGNWSIDTWNISSGNIIDTFYGNTNSTNFSPIALNSNGSQILVSYFLSSTKDQIEIIDLNTHLVLKNFSINNVLGLAPSWNPDQEKLVVFSNPIQVISLTTTSGSNTSTLSSSGIASWNAGGTQLAIIYSTSPSQLNILDSTTLQSVMSINLNTDAQLFNIIGITGMFSLWAIFLLFLAIIILTEQIPRKKKWLEKEKINEQL